MSLGSVEIWMMAAFGSFLRLARQWFFLCSLVLFLCPSSWVFAHVDTHTQVVPQTLRSASELDYPPLAIVTDAGKADGFSVALLRAAVQAKGHEVVFKVAPWHHIKQQLAVGELDVLPLMGRTAEREALYDFSIPYFSLHGTIAKVHHL